MSYITSAPDQETADKRVRNGMAGPGDLIMSGASGKLYKVERVMQGRVNYAAVDENGRSWKVRVAHAKAAPFGAVFSGPEKSRNQEERERRAVAATMFKAGDTVEMKRPKDKQRFPGKYVIVRATSPTRFKLVGLGTGIELTSPAGLFQHAE